MWLMLFAHVKVAYEQLSFENVVWVEAGEMSLRKAHNYLTGVRRPFGQAGPLRYGEQGCHGFGKDCCGNATA